MDDAIVTQRLTKYYGRRKVVDHLDLRIPKGCIYGLLGRNGAGKSTTLKMIAGMVRPDHGRIELLGEDVETLSSATRAHRLFGRGPSAVHRHDHSPSRCLHRIVLP